MVDWDNLIGTGGQDYSRVVSYTRLLRSGNGYTLPQRLHLQPFIASTMVTLEVPSFLTTPETAVDFSSFVIRGNATTSPQELENKQKSTGRYVRIP